MIVDTDNLVTAAMIGERAGVTATGVCNWAARHDDFPGAVFVAPRCRLWLWPDVQAWLTTPHTVTRTVRAKRTVEELG